MVVLATLIGCAGTGAKPEPDDATEVTVDTDVTAPTDTDTGEDSGADTDTAEDSGADTDTGVDTDSGADTAEDTAPDTAEDTAADTGADTGTEGPLYTWAETSLAEAELTFATTLTNGPCPTDTLLDDAVGHRDYLDPSDPYVDYYPALQDTWGETTWYGADVWKVQFTVLELTVSFDTYSSTVETRYFVCADDGVRLAGVETEYSDLEYHNYRITLYDPPPLYFPADRTEASVWEEDYAWSSYWWDGRAYPDSGYESGTDTLSGTMGALADVTVSAGTYAAQALEVDGEQTWWAEGEGLIKVDGYELVRRSER